MMIWLKDVCVISVMIVGIFITILWFLTIKMKQLTCMLYDHHCCKIQNMGPNSISSCFLSFPFLSSNFSFYLLIRCKYPFYFLVSTGNRGGNFDLESTISFFFDEYSSRRVDQIIYHTQSTCRKRGTYERIKCNTLFISQRTIQQRYV